MRDEYNFDDGEDFGLINSSEIESVVENHLLNEQPPYTEEELTKVVMWMEETRMNGILLNLILEGKIDVTFNPEKLAEAMMDDRDGLLFTMTKRARDEMENSDDVPDYDPKPFFDLKFGDKNEDDK